MPQALSTLAEFRAKYPEFDTGTDPFIQLWLDAAGERISLPEFAANAKDAHQLLTAHLICLAPNGEFSRLATDKAETTYLKQFEKLEQQAACCIRVF